MVLIYSVDAIPLQIPVSLLVDVVRFRPHRLRVSVPEPCPVPNSDYHRLDRVLELLTVLLFMLLLRLLQLLAVWCSLTFFADHSLFLSSGWCILLLISYRLSLSGTASFSEGCQPVLCNIHAITCNSLMLTSHHFPTQTLKTLIIWTFHKSYTKWLKNLKTSHFLQIGFSVTVTLKPFMKI